MENGTAGLAGAVRIKQLTAAGLTRAEQHGKRLDATSRARAIGESPPITTTGLDLRRRYEDHIADAFVPKAKAKAMHVIIQFPKELIDGDAGEAMLHHARKFATSVFGDAAIFADRVDRDEKSRHVVDLFVAPKYIKTTKRDSKVAVSMTRHLKALAIDYGHPPVPHGTGRALQDAWFEYLRDEMRLSEVQRGKRKEFAGEDWKSAEELRSEELNDLQLAAERQIEFGYEAGRQVGLERVEEESRHLEEERRRLDDERAAQARSQAHNEDLLRLAYDELEEEKAAARKEAEEVSRMRELARRELDEIALKAASDVEKMMHDARNRANELEKSAFAEREAATKDRERAASELKSATEIRANDVRVSRERVSTLDDREALLEQQEAESEDRSRRSAAIQAGLDAWIRGDILRAERQATGERFFVWKDNEAKERVRPHIVIALNEVWSLISKLSAQVARKVCELEEAAKDEARKLVSRTTAAVREFMGRFEGGSHQEREALATSNDCEAVRTLAQNRSVQAALRKSGGDELDDLLLRAAAGLSGKRSKAR